jgi:hypothetical protein
MKRTWILLFLLPSLVCNVPAQVIESFVMPTPTITVTPTATLIPTPTIFPTPTTPADPTQYGNVRIVGSDEFILQTRAALLLLEQMDPEAFHKVQTYVGIIEQGDHSGMWAWEVPPRYEVGDPTAFSTLTWYASTIAHDATHSELYHLYAAEHPGEYVPDDVYGGVEKELYCNAYQLEVLKHINAPQWEIDYLAAQDGTHCDVDGDGDCDWDDYQNRDW